MDQPAAANETPLIETEIASVLSAEEAKQLAASGKIVFIDIRNPNEWMQTGMPEGAIGLTPRDMSFVDELLQIVEGNKDHPIALICATGNRSSQLQSFLADQGFGTVSDVNEGMHGNRSAGPGWILRGLPTVPYTG